ncbi:hypothetical protein [Methyloglobulus sp.]|uniref:hypothetical protein n=1 Tax=Methyloglobulus sp. TaxID=2518622 RepID=UPI0032B820F2
MDANTNPQAPTAVTNWIKWHENESEDKVNMLFDQVASRELILSFRFRCGLEKNAVDLKKYLEVVSGWQSNIESSECLGEQTFSFYDVIGIVNLGIVDKERLNGWIRYSINISHEFGSWLDNWDIVGS